MDRDTKTQRADPDPPEKEIKDKKVTKWRPKRTWSQLLKEIEQRQ